MVQVGSAEILAGVTEAAGVERFTVSIETFVGYMDRLVKVAGRKNISDSFFPDKKLAMSGVARRYDAVEHINPLFDGVNNIFGPADTHQIPGFIFR